MKRLNKFSISHDLLYIMIKNYFIEYKAEEDIKFVEIEDIFLIKIYSYNEIKWYINLKKIFF